MEVLWVELDMVDRVLDMLDRVVDVPKVLDIVLLEGTTLDVVDTTVKSVDEICELVVAGCVEEAVEVVTTTVQVVLEVVIVSSIKVIPPLRAYRPPWDVTSLSSEMLAKARMSPTKSVPVPSVALLPTAQVTPQDWAPLTRRTADPVAVVRVEPIWNTN